MAFTSSLARSVMSSQVTRIKTKIALYFVLKRTKHTFLVRLDIVAHKLSVRDIKNVLKNNGIEISEQCRRLNCYAL